MSSPLLRDLEAEFALAYKARAKAKSKIRLRKKEITEAERRAFTTRQEALEHQDAYDAEADPLAHELISRLEIDLAWLEYEMDVPSLDVRYYELRHHMMVARRAVERDDAGAQRLKSVYMKFAGIADSVTPDQVLHYTHGCKIEMFYGGRESMYEPGNSPDGLGHGHVTILVREDGEPLHVKFSRPPKAE